MSNPANTPFLNENEDENVQDNDLENEEEEDVVPNDTQAETVEEDVEEENIFGELDIPEENPEEPSSPVHVEPSGNLMCLID